MNSSLAILAVLLSALALYLPTQTQSFTRVLVDGRSTRMLVAGSGELTVVFESGSGGVLEHWGKVQPAVSKFARTVAYDRAGLGLSEGPPHRDGRHMASALREALRSAGIAPPYLVVGASLGGPYVRIFADLFPNEVAGMVLVDPTTDDELVSVPETLEQSRASRVPNGLPVFLIDAVAPLEVPFATQSLRALRMNRRGEVEADSREQKQWLDGIPGSRLIVTDRSSHNVAQEHPELVIDTIRQAVAAAAQRAPRD